MKILFRILKTGMKWLGYCLAGFLLCFLLLLAFICFTAIGEQAVISAAMHFGSNVDRQIEIKGASGLLDGHLRIEEISLSDTKGRFLDIRDLTLDWSPLDLFQTAFKASNLTVGNIQLDRLPVQTLAPDPSAKPFVLPVTVQIDKLALKEFGIGEALSGRPVLLSANGSVAASAEDFATEMAIRELGTGTATIDAKLNFRPGDDVLQANIVASDEAGGAIATLLKLEGAPALRAVLSGTGPLSDWKGKLITSVNGLDVLSVEGHHQMTATGDRHISLSGTSQIETFVPASVSSLVKGNTAVDIAFSMQATNTFHIEKASFASDALTLSASGSYDLSGVTDLAAHLVATSEPVSLAWPISGKDVAVTFTSADMKLFGPSNAADLSLSAKVPKLATNDVNVENIDVTATGTALDLVHQTGNMEFIAKISTATATDPNLARLIEGPVSVSSTVLITADRIDLTKLELESGRLGGTLTAKTQRSDLSTVADIKIFATPQVLPDNLAEKLSGTIGLSGHVETRGMSSVSATNLVLTSSLLNAKGSVDTDGKQLDATLTADIGNIGTLVSNGSGAMSVDITAKGALSGPDVVVSLNAPSLLLAGKTVENIKASLSGIANLAAPKGKVVATGTVEKQAIEVTGTVSTTNGEIHLPDINVNIGANHLTADLIVSNGTSPNGNISFEFPDVSLVAALAGQSASGDISGQISLASASGKTSAKISARGSGLRRDAVAIDAPDIDLTAEDILSGQISGTVRAKSIASGANGVSTPALVFQRTGNQTDFKLTAQYDAAPLSLSGVIIPASDAIQIKIEQFSAAPKGISLALAKPALLTAQNGNVRMDGLTFQTAKGSVSVSGNAGATLDLSVVLNALPASLANTFSTGLGASGTISGTSKITGPASSPNINYAITWASASLAQIQALGINPLSIKSNGTFANQRLQLDTTIAGDSGLNLQAKGSVAISNSPVLDINVSGNIPLALARNQLTAAGLMADGTANLSLKVTGAAAKPAISGSVSTKNSKLVDVRHNLTINDLTTVLSLNGDQLTISNFSGALAGGGALSVSGKIGITPGSGFPADLAVKLSNTTYTDGSLLTASATGNLTVKGPLLSAPVLGGSLTITKASITIPEKLPTSLAGMNIQHKNASPEVKAQNKRVEKVSKPQAGGKSTVSGINLDLEINAPSQFFIRGRGIDAELGGSMRLKGNSSAPVVSGNFKMLRGRLLLLDRRLDFTSGTIGFGGDFVPTLDLVASSTVSTTAITVTIAGNASDPSVTFASSPALPQDEVLAQLIFGRSLTSLSALQIAKLADAVAQLSGGGSTSLFNKLRSGLGVDDLDVTTDESGNAAVKAGKYLNDKTYIELQQGSSKGGGKATINLDIGKGVKLKGGVGGDGSSSGGIFYEKEY